MTTDEWSEILDRVKMLSDVDKARLITYLHSLRENADSAMPPAADQSASREAIQ